MAFPLKQEIHYPESDGQPMGETELHVIELLEILAVLRARYRDTPDVYVIGNMFFYYEEGNPAAVVCPDILVARGVENKVRRIYKLWEERPPCLIVELTSDSTWKQDLHSKRDLYARLGVEEYFLFDPWKDAMKPSLRAFRLEGNQYQRIEPAIDGSLESQTLGVRFLREGNCLRLVDAATDEPLPRIQEMKDAAHQERMARQRADARLREAEAGRREAEARLATEAEARKALEAELDRLRRELKQRRSEV